MKLEEVLEQTASKATDMSQSEADGGRAEDAANARDVPLSSDGMLSGAVTDAAKNYVVSNSADLAAAMKTASDSSRDISIGVMRSSWKVQDGTDVSASHRGSANVVRKIVGPDGEAPLRCLFRRRGVARGCHD